MDPDTALACRLLLDRLRSQIDTHLPYASTNAYGGTLIERVAIDRLPMLADTLRIYVETEAVLAGSMPQPEQRPAFESPG